MKGGRHGRDVFTENLLRGHETRSPLYSYGFHRKGALPHRSQFAFKTGCKDFYKNLSGSELVEDNDANRPLQRAIEAAFSNKEHQDELRLDVACTPFNGPP